MTDYYVDPDDAGTNVGTEANPWQSLQDAIDGTGGSTLAAGDTVYCIASSDGSDDEDITATIDFDGTSGTSVEAPVRFIGVNSSKVNDGTQYIIDGQNNSISGWTVASDYMHFENFKIHSCDGAYAITNSGYSDWNVLKNVWIHDCDAGGITGWYMRYFNLFGCKITDCTGLGIYRATNAVISNCVITGCGGTGIDSYGHLKLINSIVADNGGHGVLISSSHSVITNCVIDGNSGDGIRISNTPNAVMYSRITNHTTAGKYGLVIESGEHCYVHAVYCGNNAGGGISGDYTDCQLGDNDASDFSGTDTNGAGGGYGGYVNASTGDFNLDPDEATLYSEALELP
jgi:hypothetical protein